MKSSKVCRHLVIGTASATLLTGCNNKVDEWQAAPGTRGVLNMNAVKEAFQKHDDVTAFEKRVNEIFEGDNLIVFKTTYLANNQGFSLAAAEDLNRDKTLGSGDERLFMLTVGDGKARLEGLGPNAHYNEEWPYQPKEEEAVVHNRSRSHYHTSPYFYHWYWGRGPRRGYWTSRDRYDTLSRERDAYRQTSGFAQQVQKNAAYEKQQSKSADYRKATSSLSSERSRYVAQQSNNKQFVKQLNNGKSSTGAAVQARQKVAPTKTSPFKSAAKSFTSSKSSGFGGGFRSSSGGTLC